MKLVIYPSVLKTFIFLVFGAMSACTVPQQKTSAGALNPAPVAAPPALVEISPYLATLDQLAPGDAGRQDAALAAALEAARQDPTASNRLRHAIALGSAGHSASNPVEARRLITELLAGQNDLRPQEVSLANALLREYDARVALYAELARQREESERRLQSVDMDGARRYNALSAETQRLKKALTEAEQKLEALAEMERALTSESP
jgi:hypothetical protein